MLLSIFKLRFEWEEVVLDKERYEVDLVIQEGFKMNKCGNWKGLQ